MVFTQKFSYLTTWTVTIVVIMRIPKLDKLSLLKSVKESVALKHLRLKFEYLSTANLQRFEFI